MCIPFNPSMENYFLPTQHRFLFILIYFHMCALIYISENLFLFMIIFSDVYPLQPTYGKLFFTAFIYFHLCTPILSVRNLFLFIIICKNIFLFVIICGNNFLFVIICENLFLTIIICQNLFLFAKTYFYLCALIFICENVFFYDHL